MTEYVGGGELFAYIVQRGKIEEADKFAEKARESRPSLSEVYQVKGELALAQQDMTAALQVSNH